MKNKNDEDDPPERGAKSLEIRAQNVIIISAPEESVESPKNGQFKLASILFEKLKALFN